MPGNWKSEAYFASPVTLRGPSIRRLSRPMGEEVDCGDVAMVAPQKSTGRDRVQCVRQAAFGEFDLEFVLALRLRAPQRGFGSLAEGTVGCGFAGQCSFGFGGAPRCRFDAP